VFVTDEAGMAGALVKTGPDGLYLATGLIYGEYEVRFFDCGEGAFYIPESYSDRPVWSESPSLIRVMPGSETGGVDAELALGGGGLAGTVTDALSGKPISTICVGAVNSDLQLVGLAVTDEAGQYLVDGLVGNHRIIFEDCAAVPARYITEFYPDATDLGTGLPVSVAANSRSSSIDGALSLGAAIRGRLTDRHGGVLRICVAVFDATGRLRTISVTNTSGDYEAGGLQPGVHKVLFHDCYSPLVYRSQWYDHRPDFQSATPVTVGQPGSSLCCIGGSLAIGGSIGGVVTEEGKGHPLSSICVETFDLAGSSVGFAISDAVGRFEVGDLTPGEYKVRFRDCAADANHPWEWQDDEPDFVSANRVPVWFITKTQINPVLTRGGTVSGVVTAPDEGHLRDACIYVFDSSYGWRGLAMTGSSGEYAIGVHAGESYRVFFFDCGANPDRTTEWFDGRRQFSSANPVYIPQVRHVEGNVSAALRLAPEGDASCDGSADSIDALHVLQFGAGLIGLWCWFVADTNDDSRVGAVDAALILQFVAGLIDELPP
jgi:hypothetical protein